MAQTTKQRTEYVNISLFEIELILFLKTWVYDIHVDEIQEMWGVSRLTLQRHLRNLRDAGYDVRLRKGMIILFNHNEVDFKRLSEFYDKIKIYTGLEQFKRGGLRNAP